MKVGELIKLLNNINKNFDVELMIEKEDNIYVSIKNIYVGNGYLEEVCYIGGDLDDELSNYRGYGGDR